MHIGLQHQHKYIWDTSFTPANGISLFTVSAIIHLATNCFTEKITRPVKIGSTPEYQEVVKHMLNKLVPRILFNIICASVLFVKCDWVVLSPMSAMIFHHEHDGCKNKLLDFTFKTSKWLLAAFLKHSGIMYE